MVFAVKDVNINGYQEKKTILVYVPDVRVRIGINQEIKNN